MIDSEKVVLAIAGIPTVALMDEVLWIPSVTDHEHIVEVLVDFLKAKDPDCSKELQ